ncbi:MAG: IPT/TIG domain-containing protein [Propionicimonas sp.]|uniref:IPT/TIG domain-containing protein n=1 Tax=Propionicimonas sp. TaxID=1955623 RepID=UPI003D13227F
MRRLIRRFLRTLALVLAVALPLTSVTAGASTTAVAASGSPAKVTKVSPATGPLIGGTTVTLTGSGFTKLTAVTFGGVAGTRLKVLSSKRLTVRVPAHAAGTVPVVVSGRYGDSATTAKTTFRYVAPPTVTAVSPAQGTTKGGTRVTVTGTDFSAVSKVLFGTKKGTKVSVKSSTTLTVVTPARSARVVDVTVVTRYGRSVANDATKYTFGAVVSSLSATSGDLAGNDEVTIGGSGFTGVRKVTFGGVAATILAGTATSLQVRTPAHVAGKVTVRVTTPNGTSATTGSPRFTFTVVAHQPGTEEAEVLRLTNEARATARTCGGSKVYPAVSPLAWDTTLGDLALAQSRDMAARDYFSHSTPEGQDPFERMALAGYSFWSAGENIAAGQGTPAEVVGAWLNSAGHCANLMSASYTSIGVGYATGGSYRTYWTQDFATPR